MSGLLELPDEILLDVLYYLDSSTILNCRLVNRRLYRLSHDSGLSKRLPHIVTYYLKEDPFLTKALFQELTNQDTMDLLAARYTSIIRELNMDSMSWAILTGILRVMAGEYVDYVIWKSIDNATTADGKCKNYNRAYSKVVEWTAPYFKYQNFLTGGLHGIKDIIDRSNLTSEEAKDRVRSCLALMPIDRKLCVYVMCIVKQYKLPTVSIPEATLLKLKDNPWIQQYRELYSLPRD
jgi:hypothetical protein